jgi:hypothetical protein
MCWAGLAVLIFSKLMTNLFLYVCCVSVTLAMLLLLHHQSNASSSTLAVLALQHVVKVAFLLGW